MLAFIDTELIKRPEITDSVLKSAVNHLAVHIPEQNLRGYLQRAYFAGHKGASESRRNEAEFLEMNGKLAESAENAATLTSLFVPLVADETTGINIAKSTVADVRASATAMGVITDLTETQNYSFSAASGYASFKKDVENIARHLRTVSLKMMMATQSLIFNQRVNDEFATERLDQVAETKLRFDRALEATYNWQIAGATLTPDITNSDLTAEFVQTFRTRAVKLDPDSPKVHAATRAWMEQLVLNSSLLHDLKKNQLILDHNIAFSTAGRWNQRDVEGISDGVLLFLCHVATIYEDNAPTL
jgi:hypothetical protein